MSSFYLEIVGFPDDIKCENCSHNFHVYWNTEYGDPIIGDHSTFCPKCGKPISFEVYYTYYQ